MIAQISAVNVHFARVIFMIGAFPAIWIVEAITKSEVGWARNAVRVYRMERE